MTDSEFVRDYNNRRGLRGYGTQSEINVGKELVGRLVVKVTIARSFMVRAWLAIQMLKLVAIVCPLNIEVEDRHGR